MVRISRHSRTVWANCGGICVIRVIRWNSVGFSAGQVPETQVGYVNKMCEFCVIRGLCGELRGICVIRWNFT